MKRFSVGGIRRALRSHGIVNLLKDLEIRLLGRWATTWCYGRPDTALVELTNACNMRCTFCYRNSSDLMNEKTGLMPFDRFKEVVKGLGTVRRLYLCWGGETTLHPALVEMVRFVADTTRISNFGFVSNGMRLDRDLAEKILEAGVGFVVFSLDGGDAVTHESVRPGADFGTIVTNLRNLAELKARLKSPARLEICSVLTSTNADSLRLVPSLVRGFGVTRWVVQDMCVRSEDTRELQPGEVADFERAMERECAAQGIEFWHHRFSPIDICLQPFRSINVTWDGKIAPCCNIETHGLESRPYQIRGFWNSAQMRAWRRRMLRRDYPDLCRRRCVLRAVPAAGTGGVEGGSGAVEGGG